MRDRQNPAPSPGLTPQAEADRQARLERESAALRANLLRRKQQSRVRSGSSLVQVPRSSTDMNDR